MTTDPFQGDRNPMMENEQDRDDKGFGILDDHIDLTVSTIA
jgi:hypothetical protein